MQTFEQWHKENADRLEEYRDYAMECAWNAALDQVSIVVRGALSAEGGDANKAVVLIDTEVDGLRTL